MKNTYARVRKLWGTVFHIVNKFLYVIFTATLCYTLNIFCSQIKIPSNREGKCLAHVTQLINDEVRFGPGSLVLKHCS